MHLPQRRDIDARLIAGSVVFGVGWGLAGFCPGPALVSFGSGQDKAAVFVVAMLLAMLVYSPPSGYLGQDLARPSTPAMSAMDSPLLVQPALAPEQVLPVAAGKDRDVADGQRARAALGDVFQPCGRRRTHWRAPCPRAHRANRRSTA